VDLERAAAEEWKAAAPLRAACIPFPAAASDGNRRGINLVSITP
jgi:hypothetical protein